VVLDGRRALASLGGRKSKRSFDKDVGYIYQKQIEEAQWLVINKADLLSDADLADLRERIAARHPEKRVFTLSAKTGEGCEEWFNALVTGETLPVVAATPLADIDYKRYGEGEALLGWYNATVKLEATEAFDPDAWLQSVSNAICVALDRDGYEVAHFKMTLSEDEAAGDRARVHQVISEEPPVLVEALGRSITGAQVLINLRAEGAPESLDGIVEGALALSASSVGWTIEEKSSFRPGQPTPTHRLATI